MLLGPEELKSGEKKLLQRALGPKEKKRKENKKRKQKKCKFKKKKKKKTECPFSSVFHFLLFLLFSF